MFSRSITVPSPFVVSPGYGSVRRLCNGVALVALLALPAAAGEFRLVAIGDSLTAGYGLPAGEGFVPQLDAWLAENGHADVEVVNMGVSGDTTAGGLARIDWVLGDGQMDAAIVALGGNDLLRGIDPVVSQANLSALLERLETEGVAVLIAGMKAPLNYGPDYKMAFDGMYPALADAHNAALYPFFLEGVVSTEGLFQPDGLHPNAEGVRRMVEGIGPAVLDLIGRVDHAAE